jgi:hypothetical protein
MPSSIASTLGSGSSSGHGGMPSTFGMVEW